MIMRRGRGGKYAPAVVEEARDLRVNHRFGYELISEVMEISLTTLRTWARRDEWDRELCDLCNIAFPRYTRVIHHEGELEFFFAPSIVKTNGRRRMIHHELALFGGAGGGILGSMLAGGVCVGVVEIDPYCQKTLLQRQRDGILPRFPIWGDITTFREDNPACGPYIRALSKLPNLTISGGFPCQDISCAGKGEGITGQRSGLWGEMARSIHEIRPARVLIENSPLLVSRGLGVVLRDLAQMGYDARWGVVGAYKSGAPHKRDRIWILCHSNIKGQSVIPIDEEAPRVPQNLANSNRHGGPDP